ncbi:non-oxidative hydroxyarylic acid decarboxylases subunit D [Saccharibacter sp. 17.LH.SD]|uniref:non-oxidative hydroxyarylic acid decarboxylases subunit D n=1 Tax=Saccharibacter sp. 17.LH.SD TaxID=2689393 RepID=UPI00351B54B0
MSFVIGCNDAGHGGNIRSLWARIKRPRCKSAKIGILTASPVNGVWEVYQCETCMFAWRRTEPDFLLRIPRVTALSLSSIKQSWMTHQLCQKFLSHCTDVTVRRVLARDDSYFTILPCF